MVPLALQFVKLFHSRRYLALAPNHPLHSNSKELGKTKAFGRAPRSCWSGL